MSTPTNLLSAVLQSKTSCLVHGAVLPISEIVRGIRNSVGRSVEPIDVRSREQLPSDVELRRTVAARLDTSSDAVVFLTGSDVPDSVRVIVSELLDGRLNVSPGVSKEVPSQCRVIALVPAQYPQEAFASLFATHLAAERLFQATAAQPATVR